jgi:ATP synthase protein I
LSFQTKIRGFANLEPQNLRKPEVDQVFIRMIKTQLIVTLAVVVGWCLLGGIHAGVSALAGGGAVIIGSLAAFWVMRDKQQDAGSVLVKLLKAEAVKMVVIFLTLLLVFKVYAGLVPLALLSGLGATALLSGTALFSIKELK